MKSEEANGDSPNPLQHPQATGRPLATRAKKARRTRGACPLCGGLLVTGTYIVLLPGLGWSHSDCAAQQHQTELRSHA